MSNILGPGSGSDGDGGSRDPPPTLENTEYITFNGIADPGNGDVGTARMFEDSS